jgi:hypothetical protein
MAVMEGWRGSVNSGANKIAELTSWDATLDGSPTESNSYGDQWQEFTYALRKVSGNISGYLDLTDTNGQVALINQFLDGGTMAVVWLYLYISGSKGFYGEAVITPNLAVEVAGIQKFSSSFQSHSTWYKMP